MSTITQRSFASGEVDPALQARVDTVRYATGANKMRNTIVMRHGGSQSRPGGDFIGEVSDSSKNVRLLPFIFNNDQTYVLEFGDLYMRVVRRGAYVTDLTITITGATQAAQIVVTSVAHGLSNGQEIAISGVLGMTQLNNRNFKVSDVTANTFKLRFMDNTTYVNSTGFGAYTSGGSASRIYTITTPYIKEDLSALQISQSADVINIVHDNYRPKTLSRTDHAVWTLADKVFAPSIAGPDIATFTSGSAGAERQRYQITSVNESGEESLPGFGSAAGLGFTRPGITGATNASPISITAINHGHADGDLIFIDNVSGMTEINGRYFYITVTGANTFTLKNVDGTPVNGTNYGFYSGGGVQKNTDTASSGGPVGVATPSAPHLLNFRPVIGASYYNVYKAYFGVFGFVGSCFANANNAEAEFKDIGTIPDITAQPPKPADPTELGAFLNIGAAISSNPVKILIGGGTVAAGFKNDDLIFLSGIANLGPTDMHQLNDKFYRIVIVDSLYIALYDLAGNPIDATAMPYSLGGIVRRAVNFPAVVSQVQQRLCLANFRSNIELVKMSRPGLPSNFTVSNPIQDDDPVAFSMAGKQVNAVRHLADLSKLLALTSGGEHSVEGDQNGVVKPSAVNPKQFRYNGAQANLPPLIIGGSVLYVQARGSVVRDFSFDEVLGSHGNEISIFSAHLIDKYTLNDWTFQLVPHSVAWAVRSDGVLLGLTYVKDQEIQGWHRHDFDGVVENVCAIPEGNEDALYLIVKRMINGSSKRYLERMATRQVIDIKDFKSMDSSLTYDGRNTNTAHTMTLSGGTTWEHTETLLLTANFTAFTAADVGNEIQLTGADGTLIRFEILTFNSGTTVHGKPQKTVPVGMRTVAISSWVKAVDEVSGLWHIEGKDVSVFADGFVVGSPNNAAYPILTVVNGKVTLPRPFGVIHVGLPFTADLETLNIDTPQGESIADKYKNVSGVTLHLNESRGVWVGPKPPDDDDVDPLQGLTEMKIRNFENYDDPIELKTGTVNIDFDPTWNSNGRVFIRQVDPVPVSILAVSPSGLIPLNRQGG